MGYVADARDPNWPSARSLLATSTNADRVNVALVGLATFATSVTPRSATSTPEAIRRSLERFSTWSYSDLVDLGEVVALVDYGDILEPDGETVQERLRAVFDSLDMSVVLRVVLGGDNAATWHALSALSAPDVSRWGLVTLDAHLDLRDGISNGSPVRQLLEAGLPGANVVQVGLADFSNSAFYAKRARDAGITVISRDEMRSQSLDDVVDRALDIAGADGRKVYVDIDMDAGDRSVVPGCPASAPGGLSADEMRRFVRRVTSDARVAALDLTEIDVERDSEDQRTVRLAALLVLEALAGVWRRQV
ncbi:MAG: formimidoylglutamase [Acidobacteria bacterium]|nr:formimidoylglutamase [Acidobacteriota bacterium]